MERIFEFAGNHPLLAGALVAGVLLLVFSELRRKAGGLIDIEAAEAVKLINNGAVIVDLRSADAFGAGHIVNARNIPSDELDARMSTLEQFKSKPIVAVCDAGVSSRRAVAALRRKGLESVYSLKGGMSGWSQAGLPVVTGKKTKSKSDKGKKRG
ncbi:MAG: rhodanese-like domain-containing protein [Proteobacteria bacterium]|nr:rhodanese-like domain-containing protein [Pseudomonadota bacterium]